MLTDDAMHERMASGWRGGKPFTICGFGSTLASTKNVRKWLPQIIAKYGIETLNDAGAGDMRWISQIKWDVIYTPFDLIPRAPHVVPWDITKDILPSCDAILCRHVLNHLDRDRIGMALERFKRSARYLIATQFDHESWDGREFTRLDLRVMLGEPLESTEDGGAENCLLAIWRL